MPSSLPPPKRKTYEKQSYLQKSHELGRDECFQARVLGFSQQQKEEPILGFQQSEKEEPHFFTTFIFFIISPFFAMPKFLSFRTVGLTHSCVQRTFVYLVKRPSNLSFLFFIFYSYFWEGVGFCFAINQKICYLSFSYLTSEED